LKHYLVNLWIEIKQVYGMGIYIKYFPADEVLAIQQYAC